MYSSNQVISYLAIKYPDPMQEQFNLQYICCNISLIIHECPVGCYFVRNIP